MMKLFAVTTVSLMLTTTLATAGGHDTLGSTPAAATAPIAQSGKWSGNYVGLSAGSVSGSDFTITSGSEGEFADLEDTTSLGGFAGFLTQNGAIVYGLELEISSMPDLTGAFTRSLAGSSVELDQTVIDVKARAGYAFGNVLAYGVAGISSYSFETDSAAILEPFEQTGLSFGVGADVLITNNLFIGAEFLSRIPSGEIEDLVAETIIEHESAVNSISVRAGFKF